MYGPVVGTIVFIIIWIVAAILINNHVQKDLIDPAVKTEYRK